MDRFLRRPDLMAGRHIGLSGRLGLDWNVHGRWPCGDIVDVEAQSEPAARAMAAPLQRDQKPWDRIWLSLFTLGFCAWMALMGWDAARTGFTAVPPWLQVVGGIGIVLYMLGGGWTFR